MNNEVYEDIEHFESVEQLYKELILGNDGIEISYKGKSYFPEIYNKKNKQIFIISSQKQDELLFQTDTFDELLDNFKIDGKSLRELEMESNTDLNKFHHKLVTSIVSISRTYNGKDYCICGQPHFGRKNFWIYSNYKIDNTYEFNSYDEMLDNFKATDNKPLREFLLNSVIEDVSVNIGELEELAKEGITRGPPRKLTKKDKKKYGSILRELGVDI